MTKGLINGRDRNVRQGKENEKEGERKRERGRERGREREGERGRERERERGRERGGLTGWSPLPGDPRSDHFNCVNSFQCKYVPIS